MNLKKENGAITLYVSACVIFFVIAIVSVQVYLKDKESSVENQYKQIKASYESQDANELYNEAIEAESE